MSDETIRPFPSRPPAPQTLDPATLDLAGFRAALQAVGRQCTAVLRQYQDEVSYDAQDIVEPLPEGALEDERALAARQLTALLGKYLQGAAWSKR